MNISVAKINKTAAKKPNPFAKKAAPVKGAAKPAGKPNGKAAFLAMIAKKKK